MALVALAGAAVALAVWGGLAGRTEAPAEEPLATIRANARDFAVWNGEPSPRDVRLFATRERAAIQAVSGAQVASNRPVYLVLMRGSFVHRAGWRPTRGAPPARGTVLVAAFDRATLELVFSGLTGRVPDVRRLGPPVRLELGA